MEVQFIRSEQTRPLRHLVLWPHISEEKNCIIDIDDREDAFHLGTFEQGQIISVGSFFQMTSGKLDFKKQYRLRAMATSPDFRGMNAGKELIQFAITELKERGIEVLWCDARINATGFYSNLEFSMLDEVYDVPLIGPHKFMWIEL